MKNASHGYRIGRPLGFVLTHETPRPGFPGVPPPRTAAASRPSNPWRDYYGVNRAVKKVTRQGRGKTKRIAYNAPRVVPKHLRALLVCAALLFIPLCGEAQQQLEISLREATASALENNPSLRAQSYAAASAETGESEALAEFIPTLNAAAQGSRIGQTADTYETAEASAGITERLPTGTELSATASVGRDKASETNPDDSRVGLDLRLTQSLLKGGPHIGANLARVRMARLDVSISMQELKGYTQSLVYNVETAYWDYYLAQEHLEIYRESLRLSEENLENTQARITVGSLPEIDLVAAQAEVAQRRNDLIGAEGSSEAARLKLLQLMNPGRRAGETAQTGFWDNAVTLKDTPAQPDFNLDTVSSHVEVGLKLRPDLAQARIAQEKGELEVTRTANGMLPRLDVFIALGATGYAESFGSAADRLFDERTRLTGGVSFTWPLGSVAERAQARRAEYSRMQQEEAVRNMELTVELDIRTAYVEVQRTRASIAASAETARLREETLRAETQRYEVGRSTSYSVAQAQRDLLEARLAEVQAVVNYLQAITSLYQKEGTLLERRGVETAEL